MHISSLGRCHKIAAIKLIFIRSFSFSFPSSTAAYALKKLMNQIPRSAENQERGRKDRERGTERMRQAELA